MTKEYIPTFVVNTNDEFEQRLRPLTFYRKAGVVFLKNADEFLQIYNEFSDGMKYRLLIHPGLVGNRNIQEEHMTTALTISNSIVEHADFRGSKIPLISGSTSIQRETNLTGKTSHNFFGYDIFDISKSGSKRFIEEIPIFSKGEPNVPKSISEKNIEDIKPNPKIAIVTALTKDEYSSFRNNINMSEEVNGVLRGTFIKNDSFDYDYLETIDFVRQKDRMGSVESALTTKKMFDNGNDMVIMSGVCGGRASEVKLYDIIIANRVVDIFTGKYEGGKFISYGYQEPIDENLIEFLSESKRKEKIKNKMFSLIPSNEKQKRNVLNDLEIKFGAMACGPFVLKTENFLEQKSKEINDKIIGFEMESYGVVRAAKFLNSEKNISLIVKSVMDFTDENKKDEIGGKPVKSTAAYMSYLCVRVLLPYLDEFYKKRYLS